ncbi:MAG: ABC transporter ATP-binding protein [Alphaproteobacteria bacterium]
MAESPPIIRLKNIYKSFGDVIANRDINLSIERASIHGIVGENGAGKSTLMSILYGFYQADTGQIFINDQPVHIKNAADAIHHGICMVHQHFMLVGNFSVLDNIMLGHEGQGRLDQGRAEACKIIKQLDEQYQFNLDLDAIIDDLPVGKRQQVEIVKALYRGAKILILDEPTGVLTPQEANRLFEILAKLKSEGVTILLITHKLQEIMQITDSVSVIRRGEMVGHLKTSDTSKQEIATLMVGKLVDIATNSLSIDVDSKRPCLEISNLSLRDKGGILKLDSIEFDIKPGEILGVAGVAGNGQSELLEVLSGMIAPSTGSISYQGRVFDAVHPANPKLMRDIGIAHVPEDRHEMGMILPFSASENAILGYEQLGIEKILRLIALLNPAKMMELCAKFMRDFDVRPPKPELKSSLFSGGNQQKLILARELESNPILLLVGQPTRGVDIGAVASINKALLALKDQGCAILLVSVELDEIFGLSDRIMVMMDGKNMGIVPRAEASIEQIGLMMAGVSKAEATALSKDQSHKKPSPAHLEQAG